MIFKPNELHYISWLTPQFYFTLVHTGLFSIRLDRVYQLAARTVKYGRFSQYHYSGTRWASWRLKSTAIQLFAQQLIRLSTKIYQKFLLYFMYGEQKNTRLCRVTMVAIFDTVLYVAYTSDHGRYINCNGTRYQPRGNDYMCQAKYLDSPSQDGIMTSKRFPLHWPYVGRIHCSPVYSPPKGPWTRSYEVSVDDSLKSHENKQVPESHDDVITWWISPHKGQWRGAWMFSLICTWTNG